MSNEHGSGSLPRELPPRETAAVLQCILEVVERDERNRWVEISCTVVLSLATMASAWCAYQLTLWEGVQPFRFDAGMGINYMPAKFEGNERLHGTLKNNLQFATENRRVQLSS
jgi:hypothetical protein